MEQLLTKHHNCIPIKEFYESFIAHHRTTGYISIKNDVQVEEEQLPEGHPSVWVQCPSNIKLIEAFRHVLEFVSVKLHKSITVIYS